MICVVDTNVPLIANGQSTASLECGRKCIVKLNELVENGHFVLDDSWLMIKEYCLKLHSSGQPGPGDAFLKWVLTNHANPERCTKVSIVQSSGDPDDFEEFPDHPELQDFDRSDRKFVAVVAAHPEHPTILQGFDSKWWGWRVALKESCIDVEFLCSGEIAEKFGKKFPQL